MKVESSLLSILAVFMTITSSAAFSVGTSSCVQCSAQSHTQLYMAKGFGQAKEEPRKKSAGQVKREQEASQYDQISSTGGQEYNIFVRQFGSDDTTWLPTGSIAVPRGAQVADAIYANEDGIKSSIVRTYPKLKGYEQEMEFGFNLKIYPDDKIEVATKTSGASSGPSIGNWISNLLSPVDASNVRSD